MWALLGGTAGAQVLARPGWAGSGVTLEPWWAHAVFYRIEVERFQDSDGDNRGDLGGVAERLDYLQGLGVDAVVLAGLRVGGGPAETRSMEAFAAVVREATARRLRVVVELDAADARVNEAARAWLTQGAAGIYVVGGGPALAGLRRVTDNFPGGRILMARMRDGVAGAGVGQGAELVVGEVLDAATGAAGLRLQVERELGAGGASARPSQRLKPMRSAGGYGMAEAVPVQIVLHVGRAVPGVEAVRELGLARAGVALALLSRGAVMLEYGEELGLVHAAGGRSPVMQWTPSNVTAKPVVPVVVDEGPARPEYGAYREFVRPLARNFFPAPKMPEAVFSDAPPPVPMALLPGFTTGRLPEDLTAANAAGANVAEEERDAASVLRLTRRLLQLRHDNSTVRLGTERFVDHDAVGAVVWVRGVPPGSRTSGDVVGVVNLTGVPVFVSVAGLGSTLGQGGVRGLLGEGSLGVGRVRVEPYGVFVGEVGR